MISPTLARRATALVLLAPDLLSLVVRAYIGVVRPRGAALALAVRVRGVADGSTFLLAFGLLLLLTALGRPIRHADAYGRYYLALGIIGLLYFTAAVAISLAAGNTIWYTVGDYYRAVLPFISLIVLYAVYPGDASFREEFIRLSIAIAIVGACLGGIWKLVYVLRGIFYGTGLHQFYVGNFLLVLGALRLIEQRVPLYRKLLLAALLCIAIVLSILSLKRGVWVSIALCMPAIWLVSSRRVLVGTYLFAGASVLAGLLIASGVGGVLVDRAMGTFTGEHGVDGATFERLAEMAGTLYSLERQEFPLVYLYGIGHGAEFVADPGVPMHKASTGSDVGLYHHIHSTPFLMLYRYGVVGGAVYLLLLLPILTIAARLRERRFREFAVRSFHGQVMIAAAVNLLITAVNGLKGNVMYGSTGFPAQLFIMTAAYGLVASRFAKTVDAEA